MASCGCAATPICSCLVTAGDNVTVTGTGQAGNPYVISAATDPITPLDTTTVDLDLTAGILQANVNRDPSLANVLTFTAQGLMVDCTTIGACTAIQPLDTATVDMVITGSGTTADPYIVSANAAGAGGVAIDPDPANLLGPSTTSLLATLTTDCGLTGDGTAASPLAVNVAAVVDVPCAGFVYCNPTTGVLGVDPEKFYIRDKLDQTVVIGATNFNSLAPVGGSNGVGVPTNAIVQNPSDCRTMILKITAGIQHALVSQPPGTNGRMDCQLDSGLVVSAPATLLSPAVQNGHQHWAHSDTVAGNRATFDTTGAFGVTFYSLPAGAACTVTMQAAFQNIANSGPVQATVTGWTNTAIIEGFSV